MVMPGLVYTNKTICYNFLFALEDCAKREFKDQSSVWLSLYLGQQFVRTSNFVSGK